MIGQATSRALKFGWMLACAAGGDAFAQTAEMDPTDDDRAEASAPANGVIAYPTIFFAEYRPANAQEMLTRVPGFRFDGGADVRGLGGAAGNVLIDGERPSSKSVPLDDLLRRLLPSQVLRIDLIRGGAPGIDMRGQPVVANIVRRAGADTSLAAELMGKLYDDRSPGSTLRLEGATRVRGVRLSGVLSARDEADQGVTGDGSLVRRTGDGAVTAQGRFIGRGVRRVYQANGVAEAGDARLNLGYAREETPRNEAADLVNALGQRNLERTVSDEIEEQFEIGGDYQRQLGLGLTGRLVGLHTMEDERSASTQTGRGAPSFSTQHSKSRESILRGTVRGAVGGVTFETGGEGAFNRLDAASTLSINGAPVVLPSANIRVQEWRGEGFVTASAKPIDRLSLEGTVRVETSVIRQSGDVEQKKSLTYVKPRLIAAYAVRPNTQLRLRLEREVGQLDFGDFAASGDLAAGVVNVGNASLVPETAWVSELAFEQRFWERGAVVLTATHSAVDGLVDVVPIVTPTSVFDAPGNLGKGTKDQLQADVTMPFDRLGWKDASLRFTWKWIRSRVSDPTTGLKRPFGYVSPHDGSFLFTQNLPRWRSSFNIEGVPLGWIDRQYRNKEVRFDAETPLVKIYWQYRPSPNWMVHVQLENAFARERRRERLIYAGPRSTSPVASYERRSAQFDPFVMFRIRRVL